MTEEMTETPCSNDGHKTHDGQARNLGLRVLARVLTTGLALAAFGLSYSHTVAWFEANGQAHGGRILAAIPEVALVLCIITRAVGKPTGGRLWLVGGLAAGSFGITITANLSAASAGVGGVVAALVAPLAAIVTMALEVSHEPATPASPAQPVAQAAAVVARVAQPGTGSPAHPEPVASPIASPIEPHEPTGEPVVMNEPGRPTPPTRPAVLTEPLTQQIKGQTALFDQADPIPIGKSADKTSAISWIQSQPSKPAREEIEKRYRVSRATANRWLGQAQTTPTGHQTTGTPSTALAG
jgi:hypothetical protein